MLLRSTSRIVLIVAACVGVLSVVVAMVWCDGRVTGVQAGSNQSSVAVEVHLGQRLPSLPSLVRTEVNRHSHASRIVKVDQIVNVTVITMEGVEIKMPAGTCNLWLHNETLVMVQMVYSESKAFIEIVSAFECWLRSQRIEPDHNMTSIIASWQEDRPGREAGVQYLPRQEHATSKLGATSGLELYLQPLPKKGWMHMLVVCLSSDEMLKLQCGENEYENGM